MPHSIPIVFAADDDVSVRESLELLIRNAGWQPEEFESAQDFRSRPRPLVPSCLLLDIARPGLNDLELQKRIAADRADISIVFITGVGDVPKTFQAMKAGVVGFLTRPFSDAVLLSAIRQAIEHSETAIGVDAEIDSMLERYATLRRARQLMALVASGLLNKRIGFELGISEITAKLTEVK